MKKGQTQFKFIRPMSNMRVVLSAVEQGNCNKQSIVDATRLQVGQVRQALKNLCWLRAVLVDRDENGRNMFIVPGSRVGVASNLKGINSIFSCSTKFDNRNRGRNQQPGAYEQKDCVPLTNTAPANPCRNFPANLNAETGE